MYTHLSLHIYIHMYTHIHIYVYIQILYLCIHMYIYIYIYTVVYIYNIYTHTYIYIHIYIYISAYPFRGLRGVWQFLPPLVPSYPPLSEAIWVRPLRLTLQPNSPKNGIWNDLSPRFTFAHIWEPIWRDFRTQNRQKMHPELRPPSNFVSSKC